MLVSRPRTRVDHVVWLCHVLAEKGTAAVEARRPRPRPERVADTHRGGARRRPR